MDQTDIYQTNQTNADDLLHNASGGGGKNRSKRPSRIDSGHESGSGSGYIGKSYADMSADEVQQMMCDRVAKAVALAAGVVEGFATQMKESEVTENTELAIESIGKTATTIVRTTREQVLETKNAFMGEGGEGFGHDKGLSSGSFADEDSGIDTKSSGNTLGSSSYSGGLGSTDI